MFLDEDGVFVFVEKVFVILLVGWVGLFIEDECVVIIVVFLLIMKYVGGKDWWEIYFDFINWFWVVEGKLFWLVFMVEEYKFGDFVKFVFDFNEILREVVWVWWVIKFWELLFWFLFLIVDVVMIRWLMG